MFRYYFLIWDLDCTERFCFRVPFRFGEVLLIACFVWFLLLVRLVSGLLSVNIILNYNSKCQSWGPSCRCSERLCHGLFGWLGFMWKQLKVLTETWWNKRLTLSTLSTFPTSSGTNPSCKSKNGIEVVII